MINKLSIAIHILYTYLAIDSLLSGQYGFFMGTPNLDSEPRFSTTHKLKVVLEQACSN